MSKISAAVNAPERRQAPPAPFLRDALELVVSAVVPRTNNIVSVHLRAAGQQDLPGFVPGSNLAVECSGTGGRTKTNAYSLTGSGTFPEEYTISVLRQDDGAGGSRHIHGLRPGDSVRAARPRSAFAPVTTARRHLLIAAGIGVTPILSHARSAAEWGREAVVISVHRDGVGPHSAELREIAATNPSISFLECDNRTDFSQRLTRILRQQPLGTHLYVCGPEQFMDDVLAKARTAGWPGERLHSEAFGQADLDPGDPFAVTLASTGERIAVPSGRTLLEALEDAGKNIPNLCRQGVCGECRLGVQAGRPLHRDSYLSDEERAEAASIMCCVSRSIDPEMELEL